MSDCLTWNLIFFDLVRAIVPNKSLSQESKQHENNLDLDESAHNLYINLDIYFKMIQFRSDYKLK